jgi:hypothetical protein
VDTRLQLAGALPAGAMALLADEVLNGSNENSRRPDGFTIASPRRRAQTGAHRALEFHEQVLLAEILAQHIERRMHIPVAVFNRAHPGTHRATTGAIDLYPEQRHRATAVLKLPPSKDPCWSCHK